MHGHMPPPRDFGGHRPPPPRGFGGRGPSFDNHMPPPEYFDIGRRPGRRRYRGSGGCCGSVLTLLLALPIISIFFRK